ncbi:MAG: chaperonin GroEL, partial [Simkania negevensis]|nr:chaperonin GroEL [Simkania negevensis]
LFAEEAREKLKEGVSILCEIVGHTLGPHGKHVGIDEKWGAPKITSDGNSIVKEIELKDVYANMGVSIGKEVAQKIKDHSGDGTTTGMILLKALVEEGIKNVAAGSSSIGIKRGMEKAADLLIKEIEALTVPIEGKESIQKIATISASGNQEIGEFIANAIEKVGQGGVITIEEGKGTSTIIEMVEGMRFDQGYASPYFCTHLEKMQVEMEDVQILVTDKKISAIQEILPLLQSIASSGQSLLIIAEEIEGDALATLAVNKLRGNLRICAVKAPGFAEQRKALLEDIAVLTGATLISEEKGMVLKETKANVLGSAEKVVVTKDHTTLIGGGGKKEEIKARIKLIEREKKQATNKYEIERLDERQGKLHGGVAVIRVGAATEVAMKQKKQVFEDSLSSTKAAQEGGTVVGGGAALLHAGLKLKALFLEGEEKLGAEILLKASAAPFKQIVENSGKEGSIAMEEVLKKGKTFGFNAITLKVEDLKKAQVVDPAKIVINALKYALSGAIMIIITETL